MKNLLKSYLMETSFNVGELCDLILAQKDQIGSAIAIVGQEDMFGFMSIVNMQENWNKSSIQSVAKYVLSKVSASPQFDDWKKIINQNQSLGLIVSERVSNLPDHIAPHLNLITFEELAKITSLKFQYFLIITTTYRESLDENNPSSKIDPNIYYYKIEDEIFKECSLLTHSTLVIKNNQKTRWTLNNFTQQSQLFMIISSDQIPRVLKQLKEMGK